jgi:hypothetical protein
VPPAGCPNNSTKGLVIPAIKKSTYLTIALCKRRNGSSKKNLKQYNYI